MPETRAASLRRAARRASSATTREFGPADSAVVEVAQHRRMGGRGDQQGLERPAMFGRIASRSNAPTRPRVEPLSDRDGEVVGPEQCSRSANGRRVAAAVARRERASAIRRLAVVAGDHLLGGLARRRIARQLPLLALVGDEPRARRGVSSRPAAARRRRPGRSAPQPALRHRGRRCRGRARRARTGARRSRPAAAVTSPSSTPSDAMRDCQPADVKRRVCATSRNVRHGAQKGLRRSPPLPLGGRGAKRGGSSPVRRLTRRRRERRLLAPTARATGRSPGRPPASAGPTPGAAAASPAARRSAARARSRRVWNSWVCALSTSMLTRTPTR